MIHLEVVLESLVPQLSSEGWNGMSAVWADFCERHSVDDLTRLDDAFQCDRVPTAGELACFDETVSLIGSSLKDSIDLIQRWLPDVEEDLLHSVTIAFLP